MKIVIENRWNNSVIIEGDYANIREAVEKVIKNGRH